MKLLTKDQVLHLMQTEKVAAVVDRYNAIPCAHEGIKWYMTGFLFESGNLLGISGDEESTEYYLATPEEQIKE